MTASPPAVPPDRSPYAWARSLKGALSAAQQLALRQIGRLQALELDVLAKPLRQAADALADGGADDLEYAGKVLAKAAAALPEIGGLGGKLAAVDVLVSELSDYAGHHGAEALAAEYAEGTIALSGRQECSLVKVALAEARRLIATQYRYSYEGPDRGAGRRAYTTVALGETFTPERYPVRLEFLNAQDQVLSGGVYVDPEREDAPEVPTLISYPESIRRYQALRKQITRAARGKVEAADSGERRGLATIAGELQHEVSLGVRAWERMEQELKDDRAVRLLRQSELHVHLRRAAELAEEQIEKIGYTQVSRKTGPGRATGVKLSEIEEKLQAEKENIRGLLRRGISQKEIARRLEVSEPKLRGFIKAERLLEAPAPAAPVPAKAAPAKKPAAKGKAGKKR